MEPKTDGQRKAFLKRDIEQRIPGSNVHNATRDKLLREKLSDATYPLRDELRAEVDRFLAGLLVNADRYMMMAAAMPDQIMIAECEYNVASRVWPPAGSAATQQLTAALGPRISPTTTLSRVAFLRFVKSAGTGADLDAAVAEIRSDEFAQHFRGCCVQ